MESRSRCLIFLMIIIIIIILLTTIIVPFPYSSKTIESSRRSVSQLTHVEEFKAFNYKVHNGSDNQERIQNYKMDNNRINETRVSHKLLSDAKLKDFKKGDNGSENQERIQNIKMDDNNRINETRVSHKLLSDAKLKDFKKGDNGSENQERIQNIKMDDNNTVTDTRDGYDRQFDTYLKKFNKVYNGSEYKKRFQNFKASLEEIKRLNALEGNTVFGLTKFSDMTKEEFVQRMLLKPDVEKKCYEKHKVCVDTENHDNNTLKRYVADLPTNFDWHKKGFVFPVLDQKLCLGCWAFSIVGVMESMAAIQDIDNVKRSIQELIDCSYYNNGCKGGSVYLALDYLCSKSKPVKIVTEEEYPLTLSGEKVCKVPAQPIGRQLKEFTHQCKVDEDKMVRQVVTHGPLVASVDATNWMNYIGGVIRRACSAGVSNHVIQVVGYANYNTTEIPYFLIKNSFGEDFGDDGYVKIGLYGNVCGISDEVTMLDVV